MRRRRIGARSATSRVLSSPPWKSRAKAKWLSSEMDESERERLRGRLRGVGFHSQKWAGIRDPEFRAPPPAIQGESAGRNFDTLRRTYGEVTVQDMRRAMNQSDLGLIASANCEQEG